MQSPYTRTGGCARHIGELARVAQVEARVAFEVSHRVLLEVSTFLR